MTSWLLSRDPCDCSYEMMVGVVTTIRTLTNTVWLSNCDKFHIYSMILGFTFTHIFLRLYGRIRYLVVYKKKEKKLSLSHGPWTSIMNYFEEKFCMSPILWTDLFHSFILFEGWQPLDHTWLATQAWSWFSCATSLDYRDATTWLSSKRDERRSRQLEGVSWSSRSAHKWALGSGWTSQDASLPWLRMKSAV